jgi:hypothetical protein
MMREPVTCQHCGHSFEPTADQVGAMVNCRVCGKVTEVGGLRDPIWWLLRAGAVVIAVAIGVLVGQRDAGLGVASGLGILGLVWLISRVL